MLQEVKFWEKLNEKKKIMKCHIFFICIMFGCIQLVLSSCELSNFVLFWNKELDVKYYELQLCDEGTV